jgi:hypothetical protein
MHNTIVSLALLKVNWDHLKKDYLENFLPFIATLCVRKAYDVIDVDTIGNDFKEEYGLIIPYHPMISILNRARKRGVLKKHYHKLYPVKNKIIELDFTGLSKEQVRQHEKLIDKFIEFAVKKHDITISKEEAESALLVMLQKRDLDILFAAEEGKIFPVLQSKKDHLNLLIRFIIHAYNSEPDLFSFILNMAIGHILANAILYADFTKFEGKLKGIVLYFDTRFILRIMGTEGKEIQYHYNEFLGHLLEEKATLRIFRHTYDEIMNILSGCLRWINNPAYNPTKASIACNFFVQNNYKESDIERFIVNADNTLKENNIDIIDEPDPDKYRIFQIDENQLHDKIVETYKDKFPMFDEVVSKDLLLRDIKSVSSIYRLRLGRRPHKLSKVGSMFITTNNGLAFASSKFQRIN